MIDGMDYLRTHAWAKHGIALIAQHRFSKMFSTVILLTINLMHFPWCLWQIFKMTFHVLFISLAQWLFFKVRYNSCNVIHLFGSHLINVLMDCFQSSQECIHDCFCVVVVFRYTALPFFVNAPWFYPYGISGLPQSSSVLWSEQHILRAAVLEHLADPHFSTYRTWIHLHNSREIIWYLKHLFYIIVHSKVDKIHFVRFRHQPYLRTFSNNRIHSQARDLLYWRNFQIISLCS